MKKTRQGQAAVEHSTLERGTSKTVVSVICKADLIWSFRVIFFADTYEAVFRVAATQTGAILPPNPNLNSFQYFHFGSWGQNWSQGCRPTFLGTPLKPQLESKSKPPREKASQARRVQFCLQIQTWTPFNASTLVPWINAGSLVPIRAVGLQ